MTAFEPAPGGVRVELDDTDVLLLQQVMTEMIEIVTPPDAGLDGTPDDADGSGWARELGLTDTSADAAQIRRPADPVTARLFPDAYADESDADEFRRFTEPELRRTKVAHAEALVRSLPDGGGEVLLDGEAVAAWLGGLNDARLALGTALDVQQDMEYDDAAMDLSTVRGQRLYIYTWLGHVQSALLDVLIGD